MTNRKYQIEFDVLRIISALFIVLFHYSFRGHAADGMSDIAFDGLGAFFKYGYIGVSVFFMISGYAITYSVQGKGFIEFVFSRFLRLYPTFWVAVCFTTIVTIFLSDGRYTVSWQQFLANLTMLNSLFGVESIDGAYWFMVVMLRFYFFISLVVLCRKVRMLEYVAGVWLLISAFSVFYPHKIVFFVFIPQYVPFFIAGIILATAKNTKWNMYRVSTFIISYVLSSLYAYKEVLVLAERYSTHFSSNVVYVILFIVYCVFVFININKKQFNSYNYLICCGGATYPLYLIHQNVGYMIFNKFSGQVNRFLLLIFVVILMSFISFMISKFIAPYLTRKLLRLKSNLVGD